MNGLESRRGWNLRVEGVCREPRQKGEGPGEKMDHLRKVQLLSWHGKVLRKGHGDKGE